jgi:hypothetical protein
LKRFQEFLAQVLSRGDGEVGVVGNVADAVDVGDFA